MSWVRVAIVLGLCLLLVPPATPQQHPGKALRVGVLYPGADNSVFRGNFEGFRQALGAAGYAEGPNLVLDFRFGDGRALAPLATELLGLRPDVIVAIARSGVLAVHAVTTTIPIVAIDLESDPIASGFANALTHPDGNVTGVFMDFSDLAGRCLEILKTLVPTLKRAAVLWDPATGSSQLRAAGRAAQTLKVVVYSIEAGNTAAIEPAFQAAMRERPEGMLVLTSPIFNSGRREIVANAARHHLPTLVPFPGYAIDGGLVAYGPNVRGMYAQAGTLVVKILHGSAPGKIPIEPPKAFTLAVNRKTAKALGLTVPQSLLRRADDVIE